MKNDNNTQSTLTPVTPINTSETNILNNPISIKREHNTKPTAHIPKPERKKLIKLWQESGLSKAEFCRQQKINLSAFYNWTNKGRYVSQKQNHLPSLLPVQSVNPTHYKPAIGNIELIIKEKAKLILPSEMPIDSILSILRGVVCN